MSGADPWRTPITPLPAGFETRISSALTPEKTARVFALRAAADVLAADRSVYDLLRAAQWIETGVDPLDDDEPVDAPVIDDEQHEQLREAAFAVLCRRGLAPDHARDVAGEIATAYDERNTP